MNILGFKTYGKVNFIKRIILEIKDRFRVNPITKEILQEKGVGVYVPKLNRTRFSLSLVLVIVFIALPFVTLLSIPTILWGLRD